MRQLVRDLVETMQANHFASLSAVQCGIPLHVFVTQVQGRTRVWINTRIIDKGALVVGAESCASFPDQVLELNRPEHLLLTTLTLEGAEHQRLVCGVEARLVAHEIDHQDGVLMQDHLTEDELISQMLGVLVVADSESEPLANVIEADQESSTIDDATTAYGKIAADENASQILDFIADGTWKLVLAAELLKDFIRDKRELAALAQLEGLLLQLTDASDYWEQTLSSE